MWYSISLKSTASNAGFVHLNISMNYNFIGFIFANNKSKNS